MYTILGAGLSGLSIADHFEKLNIPFEIFESKNHGGGHVFSEKIDGFTWDEGPHISFTKHEYVKQYFANNCQHKFHQFEARPLNYFEGSWIPHPAQTHLYALPDPLKSKCIEDLISVRKSRAADFEASNYSEWVRHAFGETFAENFPDAYTKKYWTVDSKELDTDWIGKRIYFPSIEDMIKSAEGPLKKTTHYIDNFRYPISGGYYAYIKDVEHKLPVSYNHQLDFISFRKKELHFRNGLIKKFEKLISTLPLPEFIEKSDAPDVVKKAAKRLRCTKLLLINIVANHPAQINNHWLYVYNKDYYTTRINFTELLAEENGMHGKTGIQVEVYFSDERPSDEVIAGIERSVHNELVEMKLIKSKSSIISSATKWINWANVIFDKERKYYQDIVFTWLQKNGLAREHDDLAPMTDWDEKRPGAIGDLLLAGRFAQWKYFWTDDCVMRAKFISENVDGIRE